MMLVNGFELPHAFLQLSQALERGGAHYFVLKENVDAYGNRFEGGLTLWTASGASRSGTDWLAELYGTDGMSPEDIQALDDDADNPGEIPYLSDFSQIACFGEDSGNSDPFCFDFRENPREPSIICYDGWYWRRVAPSFEKFIDLYRPSRFVSACAEEMAVGRPDLDSHPSIFTREALATTEEALAVIQAGRNRTSAS